MSISFDRECQSAIELAKSALPDGVPLDVEPLIAALVHGTSLKDRLTPLAEALNRPEPVRKPGKVTTADPLRAVLRRFAERTEPVTSEELLAALVESEKGRHFLAAHGIGEERVCELLGSLHGGRPASEGRTGWRSSPQRRQAVEALSAYGRILTGSKPRRKNLADVEQPLRSLLRNLSRMKSRSTIIIGFPGTGKTALVYELAWRLTQEHESIPARLRDLDIFELSPSFLRAGASLVGQYDERVKALIEVLTAHPKIILFVDEVHSLFQSAVHQRGPFSEANESFKGPLARGEITMIGCTTLAEYRHYIEPDKALADRFSTVRLELPDENTVVRMLQAQRPAMERYFHPLRIPDTILRRAVELTNDYLPGRYQPRKSLQLLDEACAACTLSDPPPAELTEAALIEALENRIGRGVVCSRRLTVEGVHRALSEKIVGQDEVLGKIAEAFVAGLGAWTRPAGPRGVFLFGGPTGVGKTETALRLADLLGGGKDRLIRVDCNTLQGSGFDSGPAINRLLGVPPGFVGYAMGQGGILSRIRDLPECVVLFDEFEKADPGVGRLLLQILDNGQVEDVDGNVLDFRRSFVVFTTNAGCSYEEGPTVGFLTGKQLAEAPAVETSSLLNELRAVGLREEFFGRIDYICLFKALDREAIHSIVERQLERLRGSAKERNLVLEWEPELVGHVALQWQPHFGVRAMQGILRNRIQAQLSIAQAEGELEGVTHIRLERRPADDTQTVPRCFSSVNRYRRDDILVITLP